MYFFVTLSFTLTNTSSSALSVGVTFRNQAGNLFARFFANIIDFTRPLNKPESEMNLLQTALSGGC